MRLGEVDRCEMSGRRDGGSWRSWLVMRVRVLYRAGVVGIGSLRQILQCFQIPAPRSLLLI